HHYKHLHIRHCALRHPHDPYSWDERHKLLRFGVIPPRLSWNFRINDVTAAIAGVQWDRADGYVAEDRRAAQLYTDVLGGHKALYHPAADGTRQTHSYHIWACAYRGDETLGVEQARFQDLCKDE